MGAARAARSSVVGIVGGLITVLGSLAVLPAASAQVSSLPVLDPTSGPVGTVVDVSIALDCDTVGPGEEVDLRLEDADSELQTAANLGTFTVAQDGTVDATVTIPATAKELRLSEGIFDVPVEPGPWTIGPACSSGDALAPAAPFTVTAGTASSTSSTSSTSSSSSSTTSTSTPTTSTTAPSGPATSTGSVSTAQARPGQSVTVTDTGFAPSSAVALTFESTPVALGSTTVDATGRFTATVTVPLGATPGAHRLVGRGTAAAGGPRVSSTPITVVDLDCRDLATQAAAKAVLDAGTGDPHGLDADRDGRPCEDLPRGALPRTGSPVRGTTGAGAVLVGLGLVLLGATRLRRPA